MTFAETLSLQGRIELHLESISALPSVHAIAPAPQATVRGLDLGFHVDPRRYRRAAALVAAVVNVNLHIVGASSLANMITMQSPYPDCSDAPRDGVPRCQTRTHATHHSERDKLRSQENTVRAAAAALNLSLPPPLLCAGALHSAHSEDH